MREEEWVASPEPPEEYSRQPDPVKGACGVP